MHDRAGHIELVAQHQRRTAAITAVRQEPSHGLIHADDLAAVLAVHAIHINIVRPPPRPHNRETTVLAQWFPPDSYSLMTS